MPEAEYEVIGEKGSRLKVKVWVEGRREPIQHGIPLDRIDDHPDGPTACIEEHVERVAARNAVSSEAVSNGEVPTGGRVEFEPGVDPRYRDRDET